MKNKNINLPNFISICRLASVPVMIVLVMCGNITAFKWLLLGALLSDIADGVIARMFHLQTKLGAFLDAFADMGTYLAAVTGIFIFKMEFIQSHWIAMAVILSFFIIEKIKTWLRYRKVFNAFHTYMSKITAYAQGAFVMSLFLFGFQWFLFYPAMALAIIANIEEMILTSLLSTYERDVKGLYWVVKAKRLRA